MLSAKRGSLQDVFRLLLATGYSRRSLPPPGLDGASNAARATASAALRPLHSSSPSHRLPAPAAVQRASSPPTPTPSPPPSSVLRTARLMPPSPPRSAWCHPRSDPPHIRDQKIPARTRWTARRRDGRPAGPFRRAIERTPHAPRRRPSKHGPCLLPPRLLSARPPAAPAKAVWRRRRWRRWRRIRFLTETLKTMAGWREFYDPATMGPRCSGFPPPPPPPLPPPPI